MSLPSAICPPRCAPEQLRCGSKDRRDVRQSRRLQCNPAQLCLQVSRYHTIKSFPQQYHARPVDGSPLSTARSTYPPSCLGPPPRPPPRRGRVLEGVKLRRAVLRRCKLINHWFLFLGLIT